MSPRKAAVEAIATHPGQWKAVIVIPSAGHNAVADGVATPKGGRVPRRTPNVKAPETEIRLIFPGALCSEHREGVQVSDLMRPAELAAYCQRMQAHYGHGRLLPASAHLEWVPAEEGEVCAA